MELLGQIVFSTGEIIAVIGLTGGLGMFWIRLEHRLTQIETKVDSLPCVDGHCTKGKKV